MTEQFWMILVTGVWGTVLLTRSYMYQWYRDLMAKKKYSHYLSECAMCTGTWVGLSFFFVTDLPLFIVPFTSLVAHLVVLWTDKIDTEIGNNQSPD